MSKKDKLETLTVKLPKSEKDKFVEFLKRNSVGANISEQHRQFIYKVNAGKLVLKHEALLETSAKRLKQTLEDSKKPKERIEQNAQWVYDKQLQCLVKTVNGVYPHFIH